MKYVKLSEQELCRIIAEHLSKVQGIEGVHEYNVEFASNMEGRPFALVMLPAEKPVVPNPYPDRIAAEPTADVPVAREAPSQAREDDAPYKRGTTPEEIATRIEDSAPPTEAEEEEPAKTRVHRSAKKETNVAADILGGGGSIMDRGQGLGAGVGADRKRAR
jgi:hypothetical protein